MKHQVLLNLDTHASVSSDLLERLVIDRMNHLFDSVPTLANSRDITARAIRLDEVPDMGDLSFAAGKFVPVVVKPPKRSRGFNSQPRVTISITTQPSEFGWIARCHDDERIESCEKLAAHRLALDIAREEGYTVTTFNKKHEGYFIVEMEEN